MKFSLEWLKYFLETDASVEDVAATLNKIGHEVEGIDVASGMWKAPWSGSNTTPTARLLSHW